MYFTEFIIQELQDLIDINDLLNTTIQFKNYKKRFFYWRLNDIYSLKYYSDIQVAVPATLYTMKRDGLVHPCHHSPDQRSGLLMPPRASSIGFYTLLNSYILNPNTQISITLSECIITDCCIKRVEDVHTLNFYGCENITDEGLKRLGNCHTLDLSWCEHITDDGIKHLGKVHTLNLSYCDKFTDEGLKHLDKVHTLNLGWCNQITDEGIKHLGKVHTLDVSFCDKITDNGIKHLGNVNTLNLRYGLYQDVLYHHL